MAEIESTLAERAVAVLTTPASLDKVKATQEAVLAWRQERLAGIGVCAPPDRPARPEHPRLLPAREMANRGRAVSLKNRIAMLHALAHIELNAIDLAWDIIARFPNEDLPAAFYADWVTVADEEARHFVMLETRLGDLGARYGDLPAHDGLWQAAGQTAHDLAARLAVVPMVLEARGLDVTPRMISTLATHGDSASAALIQTIHDDEIRHVATGRRWFEFLCERRQLDSVATWHQLVIRYAKGALKPPFNHESRAKAGLDPAYYTIVIS